MLTEANIVDVLNQLDYEEAWIVVKLWNEHRALVKENKTLREKLEISERRGTTER